MKIELPRAIATRLWQMALEAAPDTVCGIIQKNQVDYQIEPRSLSHARHHEWMAEWVPASEAWGYYQSFQHDIAAPTVSSWQHLPQACLLIAVMLDTKGLLALKAFQQGKNGVNAVDISLAAE